MWFFKRKKENPPEQKQPVVPAPEAQRTFIPFVTTEQLQQKLAGDVSNIQLVDVRELYEWQGGHIAGATHIPLGALPAKLDTLDATKETYLICQSGGRSARATKLLRDRGFAQSFNVVGGMGEWDMRGLPMVQEETQS